MTDGLVEEEDEDGKDREMFTPFENRISDLPDLESMFLELMGNLSRQHRMTSRVIPRRARTENSQNGSSGKLDFGVRPRDPRPGALMIREA